MKATKQVSPEEKPLDKYEAELQTFLDQGNPESTSRLKAIKELFQQAAERHTSLQGSKKVTLRIKKSDLLHIKAKAQKNQIPYQRLIGALIHQYAEGEVGIQL